MDRVIQTEAPCRDNPDAWFNTDGPVSSKQARAVCWTKCTMREECFERAMQSPSAEQIVGIWGGVMHKTLREIYGGHETVEAAAPPVMGHSDDCPAREPDYKPPRGGRKVHGNDGHSLMPALNFCGHCRAPVFDGDVVIMGADGTDAKFGPDSTREELLEFMLRDPEDQDSN